MVDGGIAIWEGCFSLVFDYALLRIQKNIPRFYEIPVPLLNHKVNSSVHHFSSIP
uniref:Uncharacterized protein n=1 Tax=Lepeophtheirus salmonis TaxID=72036 RepID=A0A0K2TH75_LEPSM